MKILSTGLFDRMLVHRSHFTERMQNYMRQMGIAISVFVMLAVIGIMLYFTG